MCQTERNKQLKHAHSAHHPLPLQHAVHPGSTTVVRRLLNCRIISFTFLQKTQKDTN
uniref:Uncharacterized protein n=1 Tax=Anguilla anguilla TaxID=7936 RepID=A0A0E9W773_ANGAN